MLLSTETVPRNLTLRSCSGLVSASNVLPRSPIRRAASPTWLGLDNLLFRCQLLSNVSSLLAFLLAALLPGSLAQAV
jgi:hypothetical protein